MPDENTAPTGTDTEPTGATTDQVTEPTDLAAEVEKWKTFARKHEDQAKANKTAAEELAAIKASQLTEQEKLEARAKTAEEQLTPLQQENAKLRVAMAKGLPAELIDRLRGNTEEELTADADALLSFVGTKQQVPDLRHAAGQQPPPAGDSSNDWFRRMAGRG